MLTAACLGGVHTGGAASGVSTPQAPEAGSPCCRVLSVGWIRLIQDLDTTLVVFLRGICSDLGPPESGIVYGLFSKEAFFIGKGICQSVVHTLQVWLHVLQNISGACIVLISKVQTNPGIDF